MSCFDCVLKFAALAFISFVRQRRRRRREPLRKQFDIQYNAQKGDFTLDHIVSNQSSATYNCDVSSILMWHDGAMVD